MIPRDIKAPTVAVPFHKVEDCRDVDRNDEQVMAHRAHQG
jgi:hypothetical protein